MTKSKKIRFEVYVHTQLTTKKIVYADTAEEAVAKILERTVEDEQRHIPTGGLISDLRMFFSSKSSLDSAVFQAILERPNNAKKFIFKLSKEGEKIGEAKGTFIDCKAMLHNPTLLNSKD